jgi:Ca2+-binding EF-hand superfamily protein
MSMSVSSSTVNLSQMMAAFLARIKASEQASQTAAATTAGNTGTTTAVSDPTTADSCNAVSSSSEPTLSDQVISTLVAMQMQNGDASGATSDASGSSTTGSDPIAQAFSALDTDGDGSISQSELETGIENAGGTSDEADAIFSALGGTSTSGISESSFASAAQAGAPPPPGGPGGPGGAHGHHHHHHGSGSSSASDDASQIFSAIDSNDDGSISEDELASALGLGTDSTTTDASGTTTGTTGSTTGTGSTSDNSLAATTLSAIDTNGDGSISQDELKTYLGNLQQSITNDQSTLNSFLQLANQSYSQSLSLMDPSSIGASATV